jgi:hypothetical protein
MADGDAAGSEQFLDHARSEREAEIPPDGAANAFDRQATAGKRGTADGVARQL